MYIQRLTTWADKEKILPGNFHCKYYKCCQSSREINKLPVLKEGDTCLLSYIGSEYGKNNRTRLVIVGMDHGDNISGDYYARTGSIEDYYYEQGNTFNAHYSGVIRTAAAIFRALGEHCLDQCWKERRCKGDKRQSGSQCVLKFICQPNLVKCVSAPNRSCISTNEMRRNCSRHLLYELAELDPNIIVFHGINARKYFREAVKNEQSANFKLEPVRNSPCRNGQEILWELTNKSQKIQSSYVLFFLHPSRGWLDRIWDSEVLPALKIIADG